MSSTGCICSAARFQRWDDDGHCATCNRDLSESQIQRRVMGILCAGTGVVLWRNNIGTAVYRDDNGSVARTVVYGVGNPGGADLIGGFRGRFLAVETKARRGRQSEDQKQFQEIVERVIGGVYAMVRSEREARELLERLLAIG